MMYQLFVAPHSAIASNLQTIIATLLGSVFLVFESIMISTPPPPFYAACLGELSFATLHAFSHSKPFNRVLPIHLNTTFIQLFLQDPKCFSLPFFSPTLN